MGLKGNNFHYQCSVGDSIPAQSVSTITTVAGRTISEPWRDARQVVFIVNSGAYASTASGRLKIEGLKRSDGTTWENLVLPGTATALEFLPITDFDDAGAGENAALVGTIDLSDVDSVTYSAIRCKWYNEVAVAALVSVTDILYDRYERPSAQADKLFRQMRVVDTP
jgi:hypothetical protein